VPFSNCLIEGQSMFNLNGETPVVWRSLSLMDLFKNLVSMIFNSKNASAMNSTRFF